MHPKDANGNGSLLEQSDLGQHCLLKTICPSTCTKDFYGFIITISILYYYYYYYYFYYYYKYFSHSLSFIIIITIIIVISVKFSPISGLRKQPMRLWN